MFAMLVVLGALHGDATSLMSSPEIASFFYMKSEINEHAAFHS